MQIEVKRIQRRAGITCILVTHDQEEAMSMADRVAVLNGGRLEQFAPPTEIYDRPATLFVNRFVGTANLLSGELIAAEGEHGRARIAAGGEWPVRIPGGGPRAGSRVQVCIRPEQLRLADAGASARSTQGTIELSMPLGAQIVHEIRLADGAAVKVVEARSNGARQHEPGSAVHLEPADGTLANAFEVPAGAATSSLDRVSAN